MGKPKTLRKLLEYCPGDRGIGPQYSIFNSDGYTPMTAAVYNQNSNVVQIILENGFDSNSTDMHGYTPATCAARTGNEAVMKSLLDYDIDPNQKDSFGRAPISWAAEAGHYGVVKVLIEHEANFELEDDDHETAELSARAKGQDLVPYFLFNYAWRYNGDVPRKPLIWAERNSHDAIVDLLREKNRVLRLKST
ncbi:ankyrin repeat-containing domain protein [Aspergillus leporis]|uniref:Ankyrin repeat-containing domain protein n=1 Tax=Aspergillus leporis TaxID=41062 RepID=A0A5N5X1G2_9EURO|nr:ankyrin repeat-containing domain protein [Aspergillus leporis]